MTFIVVVALTLAALTVLLGVLAVVWVAVHDRRARRDQGID